MVKTIHLLFATLLLGVHIFNSLLIHYTQRGKNTEALLSTLKATLSLDKGILCFFIILFVTGTFSISTYHWDYDTPWIRAAYLFLFISGILWGGHAWLKVKTLKGKPFPQKTLYITQFIILGLLLLIIKDAITKHTWI